MSTATKVLLGVGVVGAAAGLATYAFLNRETAAAEEGYVLVPTAAEEAAAAASASAAATPDTLDRETESKQAKTVKTANAAKKTKNKGKTNSQPAFDQTTALSSGSSGQSYYTALPRRPIDPLAQPHPHTCAHGPVLTRVVGAPSCATTMAAADVRGHAGESADLVTYYVART